ncbi:NTP transferase domain-containing protein [bacterium]|nr:NTP transferase domain-containing protein [bacterium]
MRQLAAIVLAAGDGTRLKSRFPKALHRVCGQPMLIHILRVLNSLQVARTTVVVGYEEQEIRAYLRDNSHVEFCRQPERRGTGHATQLGMAGLSDWSGDVLVVNGDTPLIRYETLAHLVNRHNYIEADATLLTCEVDNPEGYGRVLRRDDNSVLSIVEHRDANKYERMIREVNAGFYCFYAEPLREALAAVTPHNVQGEYYLTDVIKIMVDTGRRVEAVVTDDATEILGVNSRLQLAVAEKILRRRILDRHMLAGVTILDPDTTYIDEDVEIGRDTIIRPHTILQGACRIGENCRVGPHAHLVDVEVGNVARLEDCVLRNRRVPDNYRLLSADEPEGTEPL